jgi:uncharacterized protein YecE (DUF72 family)
LGSLKVGCLSWTYPDWVGSFYNAGTKPADFISIYSRIFDIVEVDSTFYRVPSVATVKQWKEKTPDDFTFTIKVPKAISHSAKGSDVSKEFAYFQKTMLNLGDKLGCIVLQMPPHFKYETGVERLRSFLSHLDPKLRCAVELRNKSWYNEEAYKLLKRNNVCLVWAVNEFVEDDIQPVATSDFVYLRFRGEFNEFKKFDKAQSDKSEVLKKSWLNLEPIIKSGKVEKAYVLLSNHFEGFAPTTANRFREIAGLEPVDWKGKMKEIEQNRGSLEV